ncbi:hypothetical protein FHX37_2830 [Haloactinospora alba]|uniref:Uncharacterized protein n=1 Tax=Haloactinospora alba TaxID=405555 RepID=A0A543NLX8_9ACTN|nr:hypothetical protein FHX37_2830 [Haloactinospora alba]
MPSTGLTRPWVVRLSVVTAGPPLALTAPNVT